MTNLEFGQDFIALVSMLFGYAHNHGITQIPEAGEKAPDEI